MCAISNTSGLAGIAHWINTYFKLKDEKAVDKNSELVRELKQWVDAQYTDGRVTVMTDEEIVNQIVLTCKKLNITIG